MRSKIYISLFTFIFFSNTFAEELLIQAKNITLDKDKVTTIFENDVVVKTKNKTIKSQYVKYNKKIGLLILKKKIIAEDNDNNVITAAKIDVSGNGTSGQALLSDGDGTFTFGDVTIPTTNSAGWHTSTRYTFSNTSFAEINSNLSCTITPRSTSSKILLLWACMCGGNSSGYQNHIAIARNTTVLTDTATNCYRMDYNNNVAVNHPTIMYIDSPNTTSAVTYRTYGKTSGNTLYFNKGQNNDNDWGKSHGIAVEIEI